MYNFFSRDCCTQAAKRPYLRHRFNNPIGKSELNMLFDSNTLKLSLILYFIYFFKYKVSLKGFCKTLPHLLEIRLKHRLNMFSLVQKLIDTDQDNNAQLATIQ